MDECEYKGVKYKLRGKNWVDERYMVASKSIQAILNDKYRDKVASNVDAKEENIKNILKEAEKFKKSKQYDYAITKYEEVISILNGDKVEIKKIVPKVMMLYRKEAKPLKGINFFRKIFHEYGENVVNSTTYAFVASFYIDVKDYNHAKIYADKSYSTSSGKITLELSNVYERLAALKKSIIKVREK